MRVVFIALVAGFFFAGTAAGAPAGPREGVDYTVLTSAQPVAASGKKIEVIEFFMYHCPHCNAFEPMLDQWVKKQGDKISFRQVHMPYSGPEDPEAHLFLTLEAMGKADEMRPKIFKAVHADRVRLMQDEAINDWVGKNGIDRKRFLESWNSFGVLAKLRRLPLVLSNYQVQTVPTVVIDGRYQTSPSMAQASSQASNEAQLFGATLQIMDALVAKAAAAR